MAIISNVITITQLPSIGNAFTPNTALPVVNTSNQAAYVTDQASLGNMANYILTNAGQTLQPAYTANFAYAVTNAAQPNITSVGNLNINTLQPAYTANFAYAVTNAAQPNITSVGNLNINTLHITGGLNGYFLQTDGNGHLTWSKATGNAGNGNPGGANTQIQFNAAGEFGGDPALTWDAPNAQLNTVNFAAEQAIIYGPIAAVDINATGNISASNLTVDNFTANGNLTANYFIGNGSQLTGITATAVGAGPNLSVQFNYNGDFAGDSQLTYNNATQTLNVNQLLGNYIETNAISAGMISGEGGNITNVSANTANYANYSNIANLANSVAVANVVGLGNIAVISLDGNSSNILFGNGVFANAPQGYSNTDLVNYLANNSIDVGGNINLVDNTGYITPSYGMGWPAFISNNGFLSLVGESSDPNYAGQLTSGINFQASGDVGSINLNVSDLPNSVSQQWSYNVDGSLSLPGKLLWPSNSDIMETGGNLQLESPQNVIIRTNKDTGGQDYVFGSDGILTVPGDIYGTENNDINVEVFNATYVPGAGAGFNVQIHQVDTGTKMSQFNVAPENIVLTTDYTGANSGSKNDWSFNLDGSLAFPTKGNVSNAAIAYVADDEISFGTGNGNISIWPGSGQFIFDTTGNLNAPGSIITGGGAGGDISGVNVVFANYLYGDGSNISNITISGGNNPISTSGNVTAGNITSNGSVSASTLSGDGGNISNIQGANVTGQVSYAATANSVAVANVSGIGNIATLNLDGNSSNILYGNGVFASAPVTYGNSNVVTLLAGYGSNNISTTGNITAGHLLGEAGNLSNIRGPNVNGLVANANFAAYSGVASSANSVAGANVTGQVSYAGVANSVAGANVTGQVSYAAVANSVAGANVTGQVSYAATANSVAVANVSGIGNIATINKDGNSSNVLYGNGVFAAVSGGGSYGNSNVATYLNAGLTGSVPQIYLANATQNQLKFANVAANAPVINATSTGAKILLYPTANANSTDYAIGIENYYTWFSTPQNNSSFGFKFYGGNTSVATIDGTGNATFAGNVTANNFSGNISITGNVTGTSPNVTLVAGSYSTIFDNTGNITLPNVANVYFNGTYTNGNFVFNPPGTGDVIVTNGTQLTVQDTTAATSTTSGALQVSGGAGIAGNLYAGNVYANNLGNISSLNLNGSSSQVLFGNGSYASTSLVGTSTLVINKVQGGPSNWTGSYTSGGGRLLVTAYASGFVGSTGSYSWALQKNGSNVATGTMYWNAISSHQALNPISYIDTSGNVGSATWSIVLGAGMTADTGDYATITITETTGSTNISTANLTATGNITAGNTIYANTLSSNNGSNIKIVAGSSNLLLDSTGNITLPNVANVYFNGTYTNGNFVFNPPGTGDIIITNGTQLTVQDTTVSTSTTTGAATIAGGLGVAGNINAGGNVIGSQLSATLSSGDEGGQINLNVPQTNTSLANTVTVDIYQNKIRFFEGSANAKGVFVDLSDCPAGVGGEITYKNSGYVNAGTFVTLDNIKATLTSSGNRGLSLATTTGTITATLAGNYATQGGGGASSSNGVITVNTTPSTSHFSWNFAGQGDMSTYYLNDTTNSRTYRIVLIIGGGYLNNFISIERL